ncbi:MAG: DsbA family protein [Saprospiraceae bacterium]
MEKINSQKDTLFYIGDPMCSWCYGFSPELDKVKLAFPDIPFRIVVGGLRANGTESFPSLKIFLKEHWEEVHHRTSQPFSYEILNSNDLIYNTEPICRAVVVMRALSPSLEYAFFKDLQNAFYHENLDPTSLNTFIQLVKKHGVDEVLFEKLYSSPQYKKETEKDFQLSQSLGVNGFPSTVVLKNGQYHNIANGFKTSDQIIQQLVQLGFKTSSK